MDEAQKNSPDSQNLDDKTRNNNSNTPCLKHAVDNLVDKSTGLPSTVSLCKNCSKTMLSYLFVIQGVLDNLAKAIYCKNDSSCCVQCLRQECNVNNKNCHQFKNENKHESTIDNADKVAQNDISSKINQKPDILNSMEVKSTREKEDSKPFSSRRNSRRLSRELRRTKYEPLQKITATTSYGNQQDWKIDFLYNVSPSTSSHFCQESSENHEHEKKPKIILYLEKSLKEHVNDVIEGIAHKNNLLKNTFHPSSILEPLQNSFNGETNLFERKQSTEISNSKFITEDYDQASQSESEQFIDKKNFLENYNSEEGIAFSECNALTTAPFPLPNTDDNLQDEIASQKQIVNPCFETVPNSVQDKCSSEAFVTICKSDSEALGCLTVGRSLHLCGTSKTLCVLVFNEVHVKLKKLLSSVFHIVQSFESSQSGKTQRDPRNSGKSLEKLNVWRLVQFTKCVFLNPDTLVLRNCDELFNHHEISAVPDTGWPDCFNSGVFVFVPSLSTFAQMEEMIRKQGHSDGGDQIFLNSFFTSWSHDLSQKLSFLYNLNLIGATTYTYAAAFQRFGQNVKIVQFSGSLKPWHVTFCNETNQIVDASSMLPTSIRFLCEWISIFKVSVLRIFPQNVCYQIFARKTISAEEVLGYLCLPEIYLDRNNRTLSDHSQEAHQIKDSGERVQRDSDAENYEGMKIWEQGKMDYEGADNSENIIKRLQLAIER